jgi:hypothetical protein
MGDILKEGRDRHLTGDQQRTLILGQSTRKK